MCLIVDEGLTKAFKNKKKLHTFFKIFFLAHNPPSLTSPFFMDTIFSYGIKKLERLSYLNDIKHNDTIYGHVFHAYVNDDNTNLNAYIYFFNFSPAVVKIKVLSEDIVAVGQNDDVCFTKYEITKEEWARVTKRI